MLAHRSRCPGSPEVSDALKLDLQVVVSSLMWVPGMKLRPSARQGHALHHWAVAALQPSFVTLKHSLRWKQRLHIQATHKLPACLCLPRKETERYVHHVFMLSKVWLHFTVRNAVFPLSIFWHIWLVLIKKQFKQQMQSIFASIWGVEVEKTQRPVFPSSVWLIWGWLTL